MIDNFVCKQKTNNIKNKHRHYPLIKRQYSSYSKEPKPPNPFWEFIIITSSLGLFQMFIRINDDAGKKY